VRNYQGDQLHFQARPAPRYSGDAQRSSTLTHTQANGDLAAVACATAVKKHADRPETKGSMDVMRGSLGDAVPVMGGSLR